MNKIVRTLTLVYDIDLKPWEIPLFRGAVIGCSGDDDNLLYHNHIGDNKLRYSYPLIQYKRIGGKAAIVCVEDGIDAIGQFLAHPPLSLKVGEREASPGTVKVTPASTPVQLWDDAQFRYRIVTWLPLNAANYAKYRTTESIAERMTMLEKILKSNILSMLKSLGVWLEEELRVCITEICDPYIVHNKGVALTAFNATFTSNLSIPEKVGLGKNASIGYGTVYKAGNDSPCNAKE